MRLARVALLGAAAVALPGAALAHGPAPAVLGALGGGADDLDLVRLSEGFAQRDPDTSAWRYVCPARWGGLATPLAAMDSEGETYLIAEAGVFALSRLGDVTPALADTLRGDLFARDAIGAGGLAIALYGTAEAAELVRLDDPGDSFVGSLGAHYQRLSVDGAGLVLGARTESGIGLAWVSLEGAVTREWDLPLAEPDQSAGAPKLVPAQGGALIRLPTRDGVALYRLDEEPTGGPALRPLVQLEGSAHGPVTLDGEVLLAWNRRLQRVDEGGALHELPTDEPITCLEAAGGSVFACSQRALYAVTEGGRRLEPVFALDWLEAPLDTDTDDGVAAACRAEWLDFASDGGLDPGAPLVVADEVAGGDAGRGADGDAGGGDDHTGCQAALGTPRSAPPWWALSVASLLAGLGTSRKPPLSPRGAPSADPPRCGKTDARRAGAGCADARAPRECRRRCVRRAPRSNRRGRPR